MLFRPGGFKTPAKPEPVSTEKPVKKEVSISRDPMSKKRVFIGFSLEEARDFSIFLRTRFLELHYI